MGFVRGAYTFMGQVPKQVFTSRANAPIITQDVTELYDIYAYNVK